MVTIADFSTLGPEQREAAADILRRALAHAPSAYDTMEAARAEVAELDRDGRVAFAALEGTTVLGWVGGICCESYSHAWELHPLVVDPTHRRRGIGTALAQHLEDCARAEGALTLYLGTDDDFGGTNLFGDELFPAPLAKLARIEAVDGHPFIFYKRLGWSVVGVLPNVNGRGKHDIYMAKRLA